MSINIQLDSPVRDVFNIGEIEAHIKKAIKTLEDVAPDKKEAIAKWLKSTYRNYVVKEYPAEFVVHPDTLESLKMWLPVLPQLLASPDVDSTRRHSPAKLGPSTVVTRLCESLVKKVVERPEKLSVPTVEPWVKTNKLYLLIDVKKMDNDTSDLIDVLRSEWFESDFSSLPKMSVANVKEAHKKWVAWSNEQTELMEDSLSLKHMMDIGEYKIVELTSAQNLKREGKVNRHCLGTPRYFQRISSGESRAFSMRDSEGKSILTLFFDVAKIAFIQIRGKCNRKPTRGELLMLRPFFDSLDALLEGVVFSARMDINPKLAKSDARNARRGRFAGEDDEDDGEEEEYDEEEEPVRRPRPPYRGQPNREEDDDDEDGDDDDEDGDDDDEDGDDDGDDEDDEGDEEDRDW